MTHLTRSMRRCIRRHLAPPYRPQPSPESRPGPEEERWGAYDASCRFCRRGLFWGKEPPGRHKNVSLVCTKRREERCVGAAVIYRQFGGAT